MKLCSTTKKNYYSNLCNFFTYNLMYVALKKRMVCRQCMTGLLLLCCRNWCLKITWHIRNLLNCYYLTHLTIRFVIYSISLIKWILIYWLVFVFDWKQCRNVKKIKHMGRTRTYSVEKNIHSSCFSIPFFS